MLSRVVFAASYFHWNGAFFFWFHCNGEITMRTMIHYSSNRCRRRTRSRNGNCIAWRRRWHTNEKEKVHRIRYKLNGSPARFTTFEIVLDVAFVWHIDMLQTRAQTPHISNELNWISKFQEQAENEKHKFDWRRTWNSLTLALQQQQPYCRYLTRCADTTSMAKYVWKMYRFLKTMRTKMAIAKFDCKTLFGRYILSTPTIRWKCHLSLKSLKMPSTKSNRFNDITVNSRSSTGHNGKWIWK